ncbi:MAG: 2-C-methyl-D-erythritol 4-phosphate cytidylyltransferase [Muribaculaceae bacterium]|nr:2-C-methyl-D-erythritol 4-phosphate cytidylyltransferase [Lachnospiraceae bacterium]MCM1294825.1 2-C-methyl-D-erythritol 4-phosphate cytidylyltransferase [Muribaculaceae bacterium]
MKYAIIVAGGVGSRSGDSLPKQFHEISGHPMLWWSLQAFHAENPETKLIVVMHKDFMDYWNKIKGIDCPPHEVIAGGKTRTESVAAGLTLIPEDSDGLVAVHDAARPLVTLKVINDGWKFASEWQVGIPAISATESMREGTKWDNHSVDRSKYFIIQTPQIFNTHLLRTAYDKAQTADDVVFTDDASVVEWSGHPIRLYEGDPRNIKVTYPSDFKLAEYMLQ